MHFYTKEPRLSTFIWILCSKYEQQVAQLSQKDRAAGWVSYGHKWKTVNERQYFTDIIGLSSITMT